jgi:hypothetical protein
MLPHSEYLIVKPRAHASAHNHSAVTAFSMFDRFLDVQSLFVSSSPGIIEGPPGNG